MAHIMGAAIRPGMDSMCLDWLQHANTGSMHTVALGSGGVIGTFDVGGGFLKGIMTTTYNTPVLAIRDNAATIVSFASGAIGGQIFQPCFYEYKNTLTVQKVTGTAETLYLFITTSAKGLANSI